MAPDRRVRKTFAPPSTETVMSDTSTPRTPPEALQRIANLASPLECTIDVDARTITYEAQVAQKEVTEDVPATGFLVLATFPSENHPDMAGGDMYVETIDTRAALPGRLRDLHFDWAPHPAYGVDVYDLSTGEAVEFTVVREVLVAGVNA